MKKNIVRLLVLVIAVMSVMLAFASCGCSHEEETIPAVEATCTAAGSTEGKKCSKCGEILVAPETVEMKEHNPTNAAKVEPTCTEVGYEAGTKCADCGKVLSGCEEIAPAHKPMNVAIKNATCTVPGTEAGVKCSVCDEVLEGMAEIPATGHNLESFDAIPAKCNQAGTEAGKQCTQCNYSEGFATIPALEHIAKAVDAKAPTCTEAGEEAGTRCELCNAVMSGCATIDPLGHTIGDVNVTTPADLGVPGAGTADCSVCNQKVDVTIPALLGGRWDYENETDTIGIGNNKGATTQELVKDETTGQTYVKLIIDNPGHHPSETNPPEGSTAANTGEVIVQWQPNKENVTLGSLRDDNYFVFSTKMKIDEITTKWLIAGEGNDNKNQPARYYSNWLFNFCLSTNTKLDNSSDDYNVSTGISPVYGGDATKTETSPTLVNVKLGSSDPALLVIGEWMDIRIEYRLADGDPTKVVIDFYVNNTKIYTNTATLKSNVPGTPIDNFRLKFKNIRVYDKVVFCFDDTTLEELEREPYVKPASPDVYTYEDEYTASKDGSSNMDAETLEVIDESGNKVLHMTGTAGEAHIYWSFDDMGAFTADKYFKMTTKIKFGEIVGNNYNNNWALNFGLTDEVGNREDASRMGVNMTVVDDQIKIKDYTFTKDEWVTLEYFYYLADGKYYQAISINGEYIGSHSSGVNANFSNDVKGLSLKTKNLTNFTAFNIYFDDTTLVTGNLADVAIPHAHTYADATCTVAKTCTVCAATDGEPLGHTPDDSGWNIITEAGIGTPGKATCSCTVCGVADLEVEIPAIPGKVWDYEGTESGLRLAGTVDTVKTELKNEDDRTYVTYSYESGAGEWHLFFESDVDLGELTTDEYFVFESDIRFDSILPTDSYMATPASAWFMYTCLTDSTSPSGDYNSISRTWYVTTADGTTAHINSATGPAAPYQEWFHFKATYIRNAENLETIDIVYYVNDIEVLRVNVSDYVKPEAEGKTQIPDELEGGRMLNDALVGFKLKFKNKSYFNGLSLSLDNTKIYMEAPIPEPDYDLTIEEANAMGSAMEHNTYTEDKYYVSGTVKSVYNTQYGNMIIVDEAGNEFTVYGTYSADGTVRYDAMEVKPVVGDTVTVWGIIGQYNGTAQVKDSWLTAHTAHTCVFGEATCTVPATCSICSKANGEALGHNYAEGVCTVCGAAEPAVDNTVLATFDFGADGATGHVDGSDLGATATYTDGDYSLVLTDMSKVYGPAKDETGVSCIKLGTSSVVGTLTFAVTDDVKEVVIYVAAYKAKATKVTVNGTEYTVDPATNSSNNGAYLAITVDTSETKTVTLATVDGACRAMVNTIVFKTAAAAE